MSYFVWVRNVIAKNIPVIGELELAFQECVCPVVAITGTKGKTTTTELTTRILQGCGLRTMASGNIGLPFANAVRQSASMDVMVLEVSSFQLETIQTFRPKVSAWLNLSANHLDRYPGMQEYRAAKLRLFENQTAEDFAVITIATGRNPAPAIEKFLSEIGLEDMPVYTDLKQRLAREMGVMGLPVSILIDREGREVARLTGGADWNSDSAHAIIAAMIGEEG